MYGASVCLCVLVSACLSVYLCSCVSVYVHDNSKNNVSMHLKLKNENNAVGLYENSSVEFDIGYCPSKVKVTAKL